MADIQNVLEQLKEFDINDIDWERIGVWPLAVRIILLILTCVLILVGTYYVVIKEKRLSLAAEQRQEPELRKSFESKAHEAANLEKYRKQMMEMEASLDASVSRLPSETEVPGLVEDIDDKVIESQLTITSIDLLAEVTTDFHIELPIKIVVEGGYHGFGAFVSGVAGMPRIVTLHDFSIKEKEKGSGLLSMEVMAKTYRYKPSGEQ